MYISKIKKVNLSLDLDGLVINIEHNNIKLKLLYEDNL